MIGSRSIGLTLLVCAGLIVLGKLSPPGSSRALQASVTGIGPPAPAQLALSAGGAPAGPALAPAAEEAQPQAAAAEESAAEAASPPPTAAPQAPVTAQTLAPPPAAERPPATPVAAAQPANLAEDLLAALNSLRASRGLPALTASGALNADAAGYARYMGTADFFGHYGPDGSSPQSRMRAAGYGGSYRGEALSAGQPSVQEALNALLASPRHAPILLDASAREAGTGYYYQPGSTYTHYWAIVTGIP